MANHVTNTTAEAISEPFRGLVMALPGGIEAQEKQGQAQVCKSDVLPTDHGDRAEWEKVGFVFGDPVPGDDLFVNVTFPAGWSKRRTYHSMYSDIVDDKGRKRGTIGYKGAFYDRWATAYLNGRFNVVCDYESETDTFATVEADGVVLFRTATIGFNDKPSYEARRWVRSQCDEWLNRNYPDHHDRNAYWNMEFVPGQV